MPPVTKIKPIGPHCRAFQRGALGDRVDGRSREGKLIRRVEKELLAALDHPPTFSDILLIRRISRITLQLELFDQRIAAGTEYDGRAYGALCNHIRLGLVALGIKPPAAAEGPPSLATIAARHQAGAG